MFFKQVWRNAAKNHKDNGLLFGSLVIAIIAFYTLLSLKEQDVMRFLSRIESDAVQKLMMLIPIVYAVSLFFVFFLVYFACKYQMDSRRKEFGMYLMLGMKHSRLFALLFCENLWSSLVALFIGLPAALFLTEGISLATAKLVGLGIIGHRISFSLDAIFWTICGFVIVQLLAMLIICIRLGKTEPAQFMRSNSSEKQVPISTAKSTACVVLGIVLLLVAYSLGVFFLRNFDLTVPLLLASGAAGTFLLYQGLGGFLGKSIQRKSQNKAGLSIFTGRQLQENVLHQYKTLAVSSLLMLMALSCISFGIGMVAGSGFAESRSTDFSILGTEADITAALEKPETKAMIETSYPVYLSRTDERFDLGGLTKALGKLPQTQTRDNIMEYIADSCDRILSESSFNHMMVAMGKEPINLGEGELALYSSMSRSGDFYSTLDAALKNHASVTIKGKEYGLLTELYHDNIVADRAITLYAALIVPDELFAQLATETEPFCWNVHLAKSLTNKLGLMQAIEKMDACLAVSGLEYDSYLGGIGRNLFYTVAASYLTIYLGVLFLLISNTVLGLKYLIEQRQSKHRYVTLLMLGANTDSLCQSTKKQIVMFFSMVLGVAVCNSIFAIFSMFTSFTKLPDEASITVAIALTAVALVLFILAEFIYVDIVKRTACREIRTLRITDRG
jgi:putative ABC transport system permease protein